MKERVVAAMSGGVDSSVAAALLVEQGYEVIGITLKTYGYEDVGGNAGSESSRCPPDGIRDARAVANRLDIPHHVLDVSDRFRGEVIDSFVKEYLDGRTPNPCVICNRKIKWEELIRKSTALGAGKMATGHYARIRRESGRMILSRGKDDNKDQSYALWGLRQDSLARTLFPLEEMTKPEVRAAAARFGLSVADKGESFEICFIPDDNYERFLKERLPGLQESVDGGDIVMDGDVVGKHRGYPFYTIGQRKGLGLARSRPVYVTGIDRLTNRITVGYGENLLARGLRASRTNMIKYPDCLTPRRVTARIRYKDPGGEATAVSLEDGRLEVHFDAPRRAVTPGQSVVLYEGDDVVGGGVIDEALH